MGHNKWSKLLIDTLERVYKQTNLPRIVSQRFVEKKKYLMVRYIFICFGFITNSYPCLFLYKKQLFWNFIIIYGLLWFVITNQKSKRKSFYYRFKPLLRIQRILGRHKRMQWKNCQSQLHKEMKNVTLNLMK